MQFDIITIFPDIFDSYLKESILYRAQKSKLIKIKVHDLRRFTTDKHKTVDDTPYGGGPGMLMKVDPFYKAIKKIKKKNSRVIMLSPQGKTFNQRKVKTLKKYNQLVLICGRYEGFDARVKKFIDEEISIGDYVLSGGELPAMVIIETIARTLPGVLGAKKSLDEESFGVNPNFIEYPHYTRPEIFKFKNGKGKTREAKVPKVLLSGNHKKIEEWRKKHSRNK